jgi:nucleotide-binding universal stress UspA family protein
MSTPFTRILVPTDFSELSGVALEFGQALAERCGASLHVLHVVDDPFAAGPISSEIYVADVPPLRGALVTEAETRLAGLLPESVRDEVRLTSEVQVDRLAARGALDLDLMRALAPAIARFHLAAERRSDHGGTPGSSTVMRQGSPNRAPESSIQPSAPA